MPQVSISSERPCYGPLRSGALGNAVKDRSAGLVVRYNRIEGGARSVDMVEAVNDEEDVSLGFKLAACGNGLPE